MFRSHLLGSVIALASANCFGLSLGLPNGQAIVGQSLNVSVPVVLAEVETVSELCAKAQVSFAETPVSSQSIRVTTSVASETGSAVVHTRSLGVLNEPYVLLDVQVGCRNPIARQYVLLAEMPASASKPPPSPAETQKGVMPGVAPVRNGTVSAPQSPLSPATSEGPSHPTKLAAQSPRPVVPRALHLNPDRAPAASAVKTVSRLQLDPAELSEAVAHWVPVLKLSSSSIGPMSDDASTDLQQQRHAWRMVWLSLNAPSDPESGAVNKLKEAEIRAKQYQDELGQTRQQLASLKAQLTQAEAAPLVSPLVLILGGVALLSMTGLVLAVLRSRQLLADQRKWWTSKATDGQQSTDSLAESARHRADAPPPTASKWMPRSASLDMKLDSLFQTDQSVGHKQAPHSPISMQPDSSAPSEFMPSTLADANRSLATEELFDLQQQVEFFISLGQTEQAVNVLRAHLADELQPSPLAYLDLLKLYHQLNQKDAYDALREKFNHHFNGSAPVFEKYAVSRRGLERYTKAITRLQAVWPRKEVLNLIETALFSHPSETGELSENGAVFDLEAYRDLLLLYGIAREITAENGGEQRFNKPDEQVQSVPVTTLQPLVAEAAPVQPPMLDIDLSGTTLQVSAGNLLGAAEKPADCFLPVIDSSAGSPESEMTADESDFMPRHNDVSVDLDDLDFSSLEPRRDLSIRKSGTRD